MKLLAIETATNICGAAYLINGELMGLEEEQLPKKHASALPVFVINLFRKHHIDLKELDGIAVSIGPGSFTGLRIGLSYAKGLAFSHDLPIIPVPTLQAISTDHGMGTDICTLVFSHRDMIFHQQFDKNSQPITSPCVSSWIDLKNDIEGKTCLHINCTKFLNDHEEKYEVQASAEKIGISATAHFDEWVNYSPFTLVPEYIAPFEMNK